MKEARIVSTLNSGSKRTSILLSDQLRVGIAESMLVNGYGPRALSRWVNETIASYKDEWRSADQEDKYHAINQAASGGTSHLIFSIDDDNRQFIIEIEQFMLGKGKVLRDTLSRIVALAVTMRLLAERVL